MIKVIIRRFLELLLPCACVSAIAVVLNVYLFNSTTMAAFIIGFLGAVAWFALNVHMLRNCYFDLHDKKEYFIANFIAYALFGICTVLVYVCFSGAVYSWIFAIAKFLKYTQLDFTTVQSTAFFHLLGGLMICLAPIGMNWIFEPDEDEEYEPDGQDEQSQEEIEE